MHAGVAALPSRRWRWVLALAIPVALLAGRWSSPAPTELPVRTPAKLDCPQARFEVTGSTWARGWANAKPRDLVGLDDGGVLVALATTMCDGPWNDVVFDDLGVDGEVRHEWRLDLEDASVLSLGSMARDGARVRMIMTTDGGFAIGEIASAPGQRTSVILTVDPAHGVVSAFLASEEPTTLAVLPDGDLLLAGDELRRVSREGELRWRRPLGDLDVVGIVPDEDGATLRTQMMRTMDGQHDLGAFLGVIQVDAEGRERSRCGWAAVSGIDEIVGVDGDLVIGTGLEDPGFLADCSRGEPSPRTRLLQRPFGSAIMGVQRQHGRLRALYQAAGVDAPDGAGVYAATIDGGLVHPTLVHAQRTRAHPSLGDRDPQVAFVGDRVVVVATCGDDLCVVGADPGW